MITTAPLPTWGDLLPLLSGAGPSEQTLGAPWRDEAGGVVWFSRSAWALSAIARWWEGGNARPPKVWVPDFFCNQSLELLRQAGAVITFYPMASSLRPQWDRCRAMAQQNPPDLFVLVHYFGVPGDLAPARELRDDFGVLLIEDAAHALRPATGIGSVGDFVCYSPHKLLAVPDGSVLVVESRSIAAEMRAVVARMTDAAPPPGGWLTRRLVQKMVPPGILRRVRPSPHVPFDEDMQGTCFPDTPHLSSAARRLLGHLAERLSAIARHRRHADRAVRAALTALPGWEPVATHWGAAAPYRTVMRCLDPDVAAERYTRIRARGGLVESWPDMPPEVLANPDAHADAIRLRRTLLLFALDNVRSPEDQASAWAACL